MNALWVRETPMGPAAVTERWRRGDDTAFDVALRVGKPLDVQALKGGTSLDETRAYAADLREAAARLYGRPGEAFAACPCCAAPAADATDGPEVFGVVYRRCARCAHLFVGNQPAPQALDARYEEDTEISSIYTDPATQEVRLREVVAPKVQWTREVFAAAHGRAPRSLLDVGAGGGHVVAGARRAGLAAEGLELSRSSRRFAREALGVELSGADFLADPPPGGAPDVITMFGLLEYTPQPARFLARAQELLGDDGLLVVEVPRADSVSTAVQEPAGSVVARHADPTTHVNLFSDASLAELLWQSGFAPVAVWYFGMDAYELAVQLALEADERSLDALTGALSTLQGALDRARLCDDVIVAAVPARSYHRP